MWELTAGDNTTIFSRNVIDVDVSFQILEIRSFHRHDFQTLAVQKAVQKGAVPAPRPISLVVNKKNNKMKVHPYILVRGQQRANLIFYNRCSMSLVSEISPCFILNSVVSVINVFLTSVIKSIKVKHFNFTKIILWFRNLPNAQVTWHQIHSIWIETEINSLCCFQPWAVVSEKHFLIIFMVPCIWQTIHDRSLKRFKWPKVECSSGNYDMSNPVM